MKKKLFFLFVFFFVVNSYFFAAPSFGDNQRLIDIPFTMGIEQFAGMIRNFERIVIVLISFFCFCNIAFNAFKLWAGTVELKKVYVDIIYKCTICFILLQFYIPATDFCLTTATSIGANCSGGYSTLNIVYVEAFSTLQQAVQKGLPELKKALIESYSGKYVPDSAVDNLVKSGMSENEAIEFLKTQVGCTIIYKTEDEKGVTKYLDDSGKEVSARMNRKAEKSQKKFSGNKAVKEQLNNLAKFSALQEVISEESLTDKTESELNQIDKITKDTESVLKRVFYNPYILDKDGKATGLISASAMLKTCLTMSDVISLAAAKNVNDDGTIEDVKFSTGGNWFWNGFCALLRSLIYWLGMLFIVIFVMCEYMVIILEYYLVTSISVLLIPLLFLDSTKSYATNLLKIFLTYFFKIIVTTVAIFFTMGFFIQTQTIMISTANLDATASLGLYIMVLGLGAFLCISAPKLSTTILSGEPQMGIGNITNAIKSASSNVASGVAGVASGVAGAAAGVAGVAGGAAALGQSVVKGGMKAAAVGSGMKTAASEASRLASNSGMSNSEARRFATSAALKTGGNALKQGVQAGFHKAVTGQDKQFGRFTQNTKIGDVIQSNKGPNANTKIANFDDLKKEQGAAGKHITRDMFQSMQKKNSAGSSGGQHKTKPDQN